MLKFKALKRNETQHALLYIQHLQRVDQSLAEKHPVFDNRKHEVLLHDNTRPNPARITEKNI